uniref:AlNc14C127G6847 protein n=1 Tax=Albugo laibachii Nc14 TaxID=890382 RepID=F0WJY1_9STRA|nr:AlNc14C127G6847 [Albugo laibachii Nc14]CCA24255.1 AlNc14C230G9275 [Albugo laibachii Nc14]|eukprot:CCA24255.1 AlNc14C230G9275 [Albugo laibachii Nc14]
MKTATFIAISTSLLLDGGDTHEKYCDMVPNCKSFKNGTKGFGHIKKSGSFALNAFGHDFKDAGHIWTPELCKKDSDNDKVINGHELGIFNRDNPLKGVQRIAYTRPGDPDTRSYYVKTPPGDVKKPPGGAKEAETLTIQENGKRCLTLSHADCTLVTHWCKF